MAQEEGLTAGNEQPERVHEDEVTPEVVRLWSIILLSKDKVFVQACRIVYEISVKLAVEASLAVIFKAGARLGTLSKPALALNVSKASPSVSELLSIQIVGPR